MTLASLYMNSSIVINGETNLVDVVSYNGSCEWIKGWLVLSYAKVYDIEVCNNPDVKCYRKDGTRVNPKHLVRCVKPYLQCEFEEFFGFGKVCDGYYNGKMVAIM